MSMASRAQTLNPTHEAPSYGGRCAHPVMQDLKSANILIAKDGSAKIADVGLAKIMSRELTQVSARGSFDWVAPEVRPMDRPLHAHFYLGTLGL